MTRHLASGLLLVFLVARQAARFCASTGDLRAIGGPAGVLPLPYQPEPMHGGPNATVPRTMIKALCTAGDTLFAVEARSATVHVYDLATGVSSDCSNRVRRSREKAAGSTFRMPSAPVADADGEHLAVVEEDWKGKVQAYRLRLDAATS